jgi:diaminohydroxyphosphoribosylaminopyrimidine deaminase/5-amino-6-(5-phosphoribosylamino)uracil reductase
VSFDEEDRRFMLRALELAARGRGAVEPNPMVGAVLVRDGRVLTEGRHRRFGGPHAEAEALAAAAAAGVDVAGATAYVTLEPCCHTNKKTPPCTEALIAAGVARVVAAVEDPDPNVSGRGLARLREAGIAAEAGLCEAEARRLIAGYLKLRTVGRPWVICKWAQSLDGRIATASGDSKWISGEPARRRVHEVRSWCDGVCVGVRTLAADDPLLTNRGGTGRQPTRVVLDAALNTPPDCRLIQTAREVPVLIAAAEGAPADRAALLTGAGAEVLRLPAPAGRIDLPALLDELGRRQWTYLLVEGGSAVHGSFLGAGLADELMVFLAPRLIGPGLPPAELPEIERIERALPLGRPEVESIGDDLLLRYRPGDAPT